MSLDDDVRRKMEEEKSQPVRVWYLSFADDSGWRGGVHVWAHGPVSAIVEAHRRQCNPGGAVLAIEVNELDRRQLPAEAFNRLITSRAELERLCGPTEIYRPEL